MLRLLISLTLISLSFSASWNYLQSGADWSAADCVTGKTRQSPINAVSSTSSYVASRGGKVNLPQRGTKVSVSQTDNGHTVVISPKETGGALFTTELLTEGSQLSPVKFNCIQFHFHAPSENTIDGVQGQLEVHFVMAQADGTTTGDYLAVLGFIFALDANAPEIPFLKTVADNYVAPAARLRRLEGSVEEFYLRNSRNLAESTTAKSYDLDLHSFFDQIPTTYRLFNFLGSLTTPPCSEAVNWFLYNKMVPANAAQLKFFQDLWVKSSFCAASTNCGNERVLQAANTRLIVTGVNTLSVATPSSESSSGKTMLIIILVVISLVLLLALVGTIVTSQSAGKPATGADNYEAGNQNDGGDDAVKADNVE